MFRKMILGFAPIALLLGFGIILAQNSNSKSSQANSNSANTISNSNAGMPIRVVKPEKEKLGSCRLISRSDAEKILGKKLESAHDEEDRQDAGLFSCTYATSGAWAKVVGYKFRTYQTEQIANQAFKLDREIDELAEIAYPTPNPRETKSLSGIGDAARIIKLKDTQQIFVLKNRTTFDIEVSRNDKTSFSELIRIAKKVAAHF